MMFSTPAFIRIFEHATPGRADARDDHLQVLDPLARDLQGVEEGGEHHDRGAVLVVVEDRDVEHLLEAVLHLEARRRGDVLQVDAAPRRRDRGDRPDEDLGVLRVDADGVGVDVAELLEQHRLALHHGHAGGRADVAQAEHRGAVGDHRDHVPLEGEVERLLAVLRDRPAHPGDARHVGGREVVAVLERHPDGHLDLAALVHPEGAVERGEHPHAVEPAGGGDDRVRVLLVGRVHHQLADERVEARADQVDRADVAADRADRRRQLAEQVGRAAVHLDADRDAVLGARRDGQGRLLEGSGGRGRCGPPAYRAPPISSLGDGHRHRRTARRRAAAPDRREQPRLPRVPRPARHDRDGGRIPHERPLRARGDDDEDAGRGAAGPGGGGVGPAGQDVPPRARTRPTRPTAPPRPTCCASSSRTSAR